VANATIFPPFLNYGVKEIEKENTFLAFVTNAIKMGRLEYTRL
jgi:hypothetical protein